MPGAHGSLVAHAYILARGVRAGNKLCRRAGLARAELLCAAARDGAGACAGGRGEIPKACVSLGTPLSRAPEEEDLYCGAA